MAASPVTQEHGYGCGVACVAYALGCSYKTALKKFKKPERAWKKGYMCRDLIDALRRGGIDYDFCYIKAGKKSFLKKTGTIVFVARSKKYPAGHYLIKTKQGWMNPWENFPRIHPVKSAFQKTLPGKAQYAVFQRET